MYPNLMMNYYMVGLCGPRPADGAKNYCRDESWFVWAETPEDALVRPDARPGDYYVVKLDVYKIGLTVEGSES